jgi:CDP-diacylglycerol---glycerol-3-phosphate 3-phosphatidyltransferase
MTLTQAVGSASNKLIELIVNGFARTGLTPNILTLLGLLINMFAAALLAAGNFFWAGLILVFAGLFDMIDGRLARQTNRVTRFGAFFDSVVDRYSDLIVLFGLLVYYASINRFFYVVLTGIVMTGSVMVSYSRARAECLIPQCKVGFMERPERVVLLIIGCLFNRMAPVLWVIAVLANVTVIHRIIYTRQETRRLEEAQLRGTAKPERELAQRR